MGLFRKKQAPPSRPVEFEFFDDRSWAAFDDQVRQSVQRLGLDVERIEPGAVFVRNQGMLGLLNVAQLCHAQPPSDWPRMLDEHFTAALSGSTGDDVLTSAQLRVRLLPDDYGPPELIGDEMVLQPFAESVNAALAFDLPTTVRIATASDLEPLGLDHAAAWELAWQQTRTSERVDQHDIVEVGGVQLHSIFGESFYVASLVRFLPDLIGDLGIARRGGVVPEATYRVGERDPRRVGGAGGTGDDPRHEADLRRGPRFGERPSVLVARR